MSIGSIMISILVQNIAKHKPMKLYQILENTSWFSVWDRFTNLYPLQARAKANCSEVYNEMKSKTPVNSQTTIVLVEKRHSMRNGSSSSIDIIGRLPNNDLDYAIEFSPWEEWLGMEVDAGTLSQYSHNDILAHCIFGMSGVGYTPMRSITTRKFVANY